MLIIETRIRPDIRATAQEELERELFREAVEQEKVRLRAKHNAGLWQRFLNWLPFTITIERKPK